MTVLKNARIITCESENFENGYIMFENGKIKEIGNMEKAPRFQGDVYDLGGKTVVPAFVDAHSHIGLCGDGGTSGAVDLNEASGEITPELRAIDGVNPLDGYFKESLMAGISTICTGPGSANPIGGTFTAMKTFGKRIDKMVIKEEAALKMAFGENPKRLHDGIKTRMKTAALIREAFYKAKEYTGTPFDIKLDTLKKVLDKKMPVKAHAHRADDIFTALRIAKEFGFEISIEHCTEGHLIVDELKEENAVYCLGPLMGDRSKQEIKNKTFDTLIEFEKRGIDFAIITDHPENVQGDLPLLAQLAVRNGLSKDGALRSITINAAKNLKIDGRVGSLKKGKDADILVFDGHPMDFDSKLLKIFAEGEEITQ